MTAPASSDLLSLSTTHAYDLFVCLLAAVIRVLCEDNLRFSNFIKIFLAGVMVGAIGIVFFEANPHPKHVRLMALASLSLVAPSLITIIIRVGKDFELNSERILYELKRLFLK